MPPVNASRIALVTLACAAVAAAACVLGAAFGEQDWPLRDVFRRGSDTQQLMLMYRLPRVLLAALVGAALSASGVALQAVTRNPLADPFVLGVSGGAALGATVALAFGIPSWALLPGLTPHSLFALLGAAGATALVLIVGRAAGRDAPTATLLAGVMFNAFALAASTFIKVLMAPDQLGRVLYFLAGSLNQEDWEVLGGVAVLVGFALVLLFALAGKLNLLSLGDDDAATLGVPVARTRVWVLLGTSLGVAGAAAVSGLVGFVGLVVPHAARLLFGGDNRLLVPASAFLGAAFLVLADLSTRVLFTRFNSEPPVGVLTALLGGPLFLLLILKRAR